MVWNLIEDNFIKEYSLVLYMDYAGAVLIRKDGKILLQLRDEHGSNPGKWGTFGGGIEKNETPIKAIIREIKEELGITIFKEDLKKEYKITFPFKKYYIYEIKLKSNNKKLVLNEGKEMRFMTVNEILDHKDVLNSVRLFFKYPGFFSLFSKNLN